MSEQTPGTAVAPEFSDEPPRGSIDVRPWGRMDVLAMNERVSVKIITVDPGMRLSLQRHERRGELWTVLDEEARVTVDEREWTASVGEQVWVPVGVVHRITNDGDRPCRVLEVAWGEFDDHDIERLEDDYGRTPAQDHGPKDVRAC